MPVPLIRNGKLVASAFKDVDVTKMSIVEKEGLQAAIVKDRTGQSLDNRDLQALLKAYAAGKPAGGGLQRLADALADFNRSRK